MDRLESMSTFVAVIDAGGFSAASRKLGMPLATVSRKVSELEEALRARLIVRSTRSIALTDIGRDYLETCRRVLEDLAEAERRASGEYRAPQGHLVVSAPIVFGRLYLAPVAIAFLRAFPAIDVELRLGDAPGNLIEEQTDVALRIGPLPDSGLMALRAGDIRHVVCASPDYLARRGTPEHPRDLIDHDCVTLMPWETATEWVFVMNQRTEKVPVRSRFSVTTAETAVDAAVAGLGITHLFCYQVSKPIAEGTLKVLMPGFEPPPFPVHFVYPGGRQIPQKLRAFLDFVIPRIKAKLVFEG